MSSTSQDSQKKLNTAIFSRLAIPKLASVRLNRSKKSFKAKREDSHATKSADSIVLRIDSWKKPAKRYSMGWGGVLSRPHTPDIPTHKEIIARENAAISIQKWYRSRHVVRLHYVTMTLLHLIKQLDRDLVLFWKLLHEGLSVIKYNYTGKKKSRRYLCLSPDCERLIVGKPMSTSARYIYKATTRFFPTEKGLYLRDISDVRPGITTFSFTASTLNPNAERCFSIIGSERTINLEMPTHAARDQAVSRFRVIVDVLQGPNSALASRLWRTPKLPECVEPEKLECVYAFLLAGVHVMRFFDKGYEVDNVLWVDLSTQQLNCIETKGSSTKGLMLPDIVEIRRGINSNLIAQLIPTPSISQCFSIIGSEYSLECQVLNQSTRDTICTALQIILLDNLTCNKSIQNERQIQYGKQPPVGYNQSIALQIDI